VSYQGFYINLDRSPARRAHIEGELARYGLSHRYRRFAAADGNVLNFPNPHLSTAEIGCFSSHYELLRQNIASPQHLHILEDDAVLSHLTAQTIDKTISSGLIDQYDVLFTETFLTPINFDYGDAIGLWEKAVERDAAGAIVDIRPTVIRHIGGTSSYLVNRRSIPRLLEILERELGRGAAEGIDIFMRQAMSQGMLATGCLFPFVTGVQLDDVVDSTIPGRSQGKLTQIAATLGRTVFFVGADLAALNALAVQHLPAPENDPRHALLNRILGFTLTDKFQRY
jgi:GR25 family glycosyltransferase involved in LPS biosynthesis